MFGAGKVTVPRSRRGGVRAAVDMLVGDAGGSVWVCAVGVELSRALAFIDGVWKTRTGQGKWPSLKPGKPGKSDIRREIGKSNEQIK
jgi:hypothetical protein